MSFQLPPDLVAWLGSQVGLDPRSLDCPRGDWSIYLAAAAGIDIRTIVRAVCGVLADVLDGYETQPSVAQSLAIATRWAEGHAQPDRTPLAAELDAAVEAESSEAGEAHARMRVLGALQSLIFAIDSVEAVSACPPGSRLALAGLNNATRSLADAMYSAAAAPIEGDQVSVAYDEDADLIDPERFGANMRALAVLFRAALAA